MMEATDDDDDLKLVKASATLLDELVASLPKLLWQRSKTGSGHGLAHKWVKQRDLEYVIRLIEPFQGEPQLLDARLKHFLPQIVEAFVESIARDVQDDDTSDIDIQTAICRLVYTLCKVRGYRVVVGFMNNEPRYLEPMLKRLEVVMNAESTETVEWEVPYVLLLWLSHLMLTPFGLDSISPARAAGDPNPLPILVERTMSLGLHYLRSTTKAQEAAATLLLRLVARPDMTILRYCDGALFGALLEKQEVLIATDTVYQRLGSLRFFAGCASSPELITIIPRLYSYCRTIAEAQTTPTATDAVAKKLIIKTYRNTVLAALRITNPSLAPWTRDTDMIEEVIEHLLQSLGDRDTPVRFAAAKALSRLILELDPAMGLQVIEAVLEGLKEDIPQNNEALDFRNADALRWHGLTLTLAHVLFKRSAVPDQLPDIVSALTSALQFEQRTATGSSVGTNVRDAANFGLWALSRRYTTAELLSVKTVNLKHLATPSKTHSVIQAIAIQMILAACLDPVGNIRRGASAALQELVGRHPNEVLQGISLVQIVDYQAVGLRRRAMIDVASRVASLMDPQRLYWTALVDGVLGWRGVRAPDVPSREYAALALARFSHFSLESLLHCIVTVKAQMVPRLEVEAQHGLMLSMVYLLEVFLRRLQDNDSMIDENAVALSRSDIQLLVGVTMKSTHRFDTVILRSELPVAVAKLVTAVCDVVRRRSTVNISSWVNEVTGRLLSRHEEIIQVEVPSLIEALVAYKRSVDEPLTTVAALSLSKQVARDASSSTLHGACRAIALGALAPLYDGGLQADDACLAVTTLAKLVKAMNIDWRVIGLKALRLAVEGLGADDAVDESLAETLVQALHTGLNDYTIDERGDVGSLVRLQAIACTSCILGKTALQDRKLLWEMLAADIYRLSLDKLDRVRMEAARCQAQHLGLEIQVTDVASISSTSYFARTLAPLRGNISEWQIKALLEGCVSCAGLGAESVLQASRSTLVRILQQSTDERLLLLLSTFTGIMKELLTSINNNMNPALELLGFLLDMQIPQRFANSNFKWRNLLSTVQKSHHKSNDIPKIVAAVQVYRNMADVASLRGEVLKKLIGMLKTNPYPRVRLAVAEALFCVTEETSMKAVDWMKPPSTNAAVLQKLHDQYLVP